MKRRRDDDQEQESKRSRVMKVINEMNRVAQERERNRQEEFKSYAEPLLSPTFLRSLPLAARNIERKTWQQEEQEEETRRQQKEEEEEESKQPFYLRVLEKSQRPDVAVFVPPKLTKKDWEYYPTREAEPSGLFDLSELTNLIHQYSFPEEYGTPREKCFKETRSSQTEGKEEVKSPCLTRVEEFSKATSKANEEDEVVSFARFECALYCLLTNLPSMMIFTKNEENEQIRIPFMLRVMIAPKNGLKSSKVEIYYDRDLEKHLAKVEVIYGISKIENVSVEEAIDFIFHNGQVGNIMVFTSAFLIGISPNPTKWSFKFNNNDWNLFHPPLHRPSLMFKLE
jgi:hypothetical protein